MLTAMLNSSAKIIAPSEEPFLLYFKSKYGSINHWSDQKLLTFANDFFLLHDKNLNVYFNSRSALEKSLLSMDRNSSYLDVCKQVYLNFYPEKDKAQVQTIIDKQIKYSYLPNKIVESCPDSKFIILTRNPLDNLASWKKRGLGNNDKANYLSEVWNDANTILYSFLTRNKEICLHIKYEELATRPESTLKEICTFLGLEFDPGMLNFNENFSEFTEKSTSRDPKFIEKLNDFHSGLHQSANEENIDIYTNFFNTSEVDLIIQNCNATAADFGYSLPPASAITKGISGFTKFKSRWSRRYKLKVYFLIPFGFKKMFRKIRKKKVAA